MRAWLIVLAACSGNVDGGGPGGGHPDGAAPPGDESAHKFCVDETNRYRTMGSRAAVAESTQLESYADTGAMIDFGSSPHSHFMQTQGGGISFAENECPHWNLQQSGGDMNMLLAMCIAAFYSEGPGGGHYDNMMNTAYSKLGCGIFMSGSEVTIVQDYGH
jgi:hypothetical protein